MGRETVGSGGASEEDAERLGEEGEAGFCWGKSVVPLRARSKQKTRTQTAVTVKNFIDMGPLGCACELRRPVRVLPCKMVRTLLGASASVMPQKIARKKKGKTDAKSPNIYEILGLPAEGRKSLRDEGDDNLGFRPLKRFQISLPEQGEDD